MAGLKMYKEKIGNGDNGFTDFYTGRVSKTDDNVVLMGLIDEINAICGFIVSKYNISILKEIEKINISVMGNIAGYVAREKILDSIKFIEDEIKKINNADVKEFVLFDRDEKTSILNVLRTKIRIAETQSWKTNKTEVSIYLNRLSDLIFLIALKELS
jgi:ATP:cob(I)alamin adenosyltransferase